MLSNIAPSVITSSAPPPLDLPGTQLGFTPASNVNIDPHTGVTHVEHDDGSVTISFGPDATEDKDSEFDDNLAEEGKIDESTLNLMCEEILRGVEEDERSRKDWEDTYARGIELLGLKLEDPSSMVSAAGNVSKVHHPLLIEAVVLYQAKASAELLPAAGPVKVRDDNSEGADPQRTVMAEAFEKDFNHYLTVVRKEYYPHTRRMLFAQGFCGNGFKKVYRCPLRKAPVSDYVAAKDLIVSNEATDLANAARVTHRTTMRYSVMRRMQLSGHYRDIKLGQPTSQPTDVDKKIASVEGVDKQISLPSDYPYTIYEVYTEYDIPGFKHKDSDDEESGMPLPYRITIDKDSRKILEVRRNWKEDDDDYIARQVFVKYGYVPGLGFYDYGLVHLLGQTARALTAIERQLIDAGQFSNFPGVLISDVGGRQETTQLQVPPGGATVIKTGGMPIGQVVMALPYKEPSGVLVNIAKAIEDNGRRLGGTNEVQVGEGRADVPVGTTIALIEQSTKMEGAVHKQNHESQQQEFILMKELFEAEPEALIRGNKKPAHKWQTAQEIADQDLVPASDPNTPSHIHRVMKATGLAQLVQQDPSGYNVRAVRTILLTTLGYSPAALLAPPAPPGAGGPQPDPAKMAKVQVDQAKVDEKKQSTMLNAQLKAKENETEMADRKEERESRERIQQMKNIGTSIQQEGQQKADLIKESHGFQAEIAGKNMEHHHGLQESELEHQHDLQKQSLDHAHEKDVAESSNDVVSSENN